MSVTGVNQSTKPASSKASARPDQFTVSVDDKSYTFTLAEEKDGSSAIKFRIRENDNLFRVSLAAKEVQRKFPGIKLRQHTASEIAAFNGISDVASVSVGQVVSVGVSGYKQKPAVQEKPKVNKPTHSDSPPVARPVVVKIVPSDPQEALALSFVLKVGGNKVGMDKAKLIWNSVRKCSSQYGIDPLFVLCVIARESSFDQNIVSGEGCVGLMQVSPKTAAKIGVSADDLTDINKSVEAGMKYLVERCDLRQNAILGLAGYNAGPDKAEKSIKSYFSTKFTNYGQVDLKTYDQTKHYLFCISKAYEALKDGDFEGAAQRSGGEYTKDEMMAFIWGVRDGTIGLDPFLETKVAISR